jgi:phosphoribosylanthranilate isomerase
VRHLLLLDTARAGLDGGTGQVWPWHTASAIMSRRDVMLAGGLSAGNVAEAVRALRPFGVDASSGLESSPGRKDPERVRRYIEAVRLCDASLEEAR